MTESAPWRSLNSVMIVTLYVAVVAYGIRVLTRPISLAGSFGFWAPLAIVVALGLCWPLGQAISRAFDSEPGFGRICPRCQGGTLRPLLRAGGGLFQPLTGYRCTICRLTIRVVDGRTFEEAPHEPTEPEVPDTTGIAFVEPPAPTSTASPGEIQFLDDR
jgi:hypothetical protein